MFVSEYSVIIDKPIDFVFANATCLKGCINWIAGMRETEKLSQEPTTVGTQYRHVYSIMGMTGEAVVTVRRYEPPYAFSYDDNSKEPITALNDYSFKEVDGGTQVTHKFTLIPRQDIIGRLSAALIVNAIFKQAHHNMDTLKMMLDDGIVVQAQD